MPGLRNVRGQISGLGGPIIFKDGTHAFFDGAKDMFKYYFNLKRYNPSKGLQDIDSVYVMDYYDLAWIDGTRAFYVIGSDVYGPMGRELIPFKDETGGKRVSERPQGEVRIDVQRGRPGGDQGAG